MSEVHTSFSPFLPAPYAEPFRPAYPLFVEPPMPAAVSHVEINRESKAFVDPNEFAKSKSHQEDLKKRQEVLKEKGIAKLLESKKGYDSESVSIEDTVRDRQRMARQALQRARESGDVYKFQDTAAEHIVTMLRAVDYYNVPEMIESSISGIDEGQIDRAYWQLRWVYGAIVEDQPERVVGREVYQAATVALGYMALNARDQFEQAAAMQALESL